MYLQSVSTIYYSSIFFAEAVKRIFGFYILRILHLIVETGRDRIIQLSVKYIFALQQVPD